MSTDMSREVFSSGKAFLGCKQSEEGAPHMPTQLTNCFH